MRNLLAACVAGIAGMAISTAAGAVTIGTAELLACDGGPSCSIAGAPGATISATGGDLQAKAGGATNTIGLGVSGGTNGEIDIATEALTIAFDYAQVVDSFRIVFFYNGPEFADVYEKGTVTANFDDGSSSVFTFGATGANGVLTWDGFGSYANSCGSQTAGGSGCFDFTGEPLGSALVTSIVFNAIPGNTVNGGTNQSDYSFGGLVATPIPGSLLLLLTGIGGLSFASRGRRKVAAA